MVKKLANKKSKVVIKSESEGSFVSGEEYEAKPGEKTMTFSGDVPHSGEEGSYGSEGDMDDMDDMSDGDDSIGGASLFSGEEGVDVDLGEE
jgi:hypothetical protein